MDRIRNLIISAAICLLAGCSVLQQSSNVHQPMTARPLTNTPIASGSGAIFGNSGRSLFEDRRARYVGDTLTINLVERTQASKSSNASANRASTTAVGTPVITGLPGGGIVGKISAAADSTLDFRQGRGSGQQCLHRYGYRHRDRILPERKPAGLRREIGGNQSGAGIHPVFRGGESDLRHRQQYRAVDAGGRCTG